MFHSFLHIGVLTILSLKNTNCIHVNSMKYFTKTGEKCSNSKRYPISGRNAMHDLVKRLPGGDGSDGMTDVTIAAVICALNEVILTSSENCKVLKDTGGTELKMFYLTKN